MSALFKRIGVGVVALDLLVGGVAAAALHKHAGLSAAAAGGPKLSALQLEQQLGDGASVSCSSDPSGGWDYYCIGSDGSRALYDVSADRVTHKSDLPSYR
jgi:hypothetical protein